MMRWLGKWVIVALSLGWLAWELWTNLDDLLGLDPDRSTWPLTWIITTYVAPIVYFPAVCLLAGWLIWHFWPGRTHRPTSNPEGIMMSAPVESTWHKRFDALQRAVRTLVGGLITVALAAAGTYLTTLAVSDVQWTPEYGKAVLAGLALAVLNAVVSYVQRLVSTPKAPAAPA